MISFGKEYRFKKQGGKKHWLTGKVTYNTVTYEETPELVKAECIGEGHNECTWATNSSQGGGSSSQFAGIIYEVESAVSGGSESGSGTFEQDGESFTYSYTGNVDSEGLLNYVLIIQST